MSSNNPRQGKRVRHIKAVYKSMSDERCEAIDSRIRDIAHDLGAALQLAMNQAADAATNEFEKLLAEGYTDDKIQAILSHQNSGHFEHPFCRSVREVWAFHWVTEAELRRSKIRTTKPRRAKSAVRALKLEIVPGGKGEVRPVEDE